MDRSRHGAATRLWLNRLLVLSRACPKLLFPAGAAGREEEAYSFDSSIERREKMIMEELEESR